MLSDPPSITNLNNFKCIVLSRKNNFREKSMKVLYSVVIEILLYCSTEYVMYSSVHYLVVHWDSAPAS
jgi:hypothetical protein